MEDTTISNENNSKGLQKKITVFINAIQVEPAVLLFGFAGGLEDVTLTNLIIDKVCDVQLEYEEHTCENLDSGQYEDEQNKVQRLTSIYGMERHFTEYLPGAITVFLLAALGQSRGLKLPLMVTIFGALLKVLVIIFNVVYWALAPVFIILSFLPYAICGGYSGYWMTVYAYLGLTTDKKSRITRFAIITVLEYAGRSLGEITAPTIFNQFGYLGVFVSQAMFYSLSLLYVIFFLKNCKPESQSDSSENNDSENMIERIKTTFLTAFKKRENRGRPQVIGHISGLSLYVFIMGVPNFYYLYTRKQFSWDYESYSYWSAISNPATLVGTMLILPSLSYIWNVRDSIIALTGYISRMCQFMLIATAPVGWVMYVATLTSVCGGMIQTASRSALSKMLPATEITAVYAVISALESIIPVVDNPLYTYIYNATLEIYPGTVFAIGSVLSCIGCFLYTWLSTSFPREVKIQKQPVDDDTKEKGGGSNIEIIPEVVLTSQQGEVEGL